MPGTTQWMEVRTGGLGEDAGPVLHACHGEAPQPTQALCTPLGAHLHNEEESEGPEDGELWVIPFEP